MEPELNKFPEDISKRLWEAYSPKHPRQPVDQLTIPITDDLEIFILEEGLIGGIRWSF